MECKALECWSLSDYNEIAPPLGTSVLKEQSYFCAEIWSLIWAEDTMKLEETGRKLVSFA